MPVCHAGFPAMFCAGLRMVGAGHHVAEAGCSKGMCSRPVLLVRLVEVEVAASCGVCLCLCIFVAASAQVLQALQELLAPSGCVLWTVCASLPTGPPRLWCMVHLMLLFWDLVATCTFLFGVS